MTVPSLFAHFTTRELDIIDRLANGDRPTWMAEQIGLATNTIQNLCADMRDRVGAKTNAQLVAMAVREGAIS